MDSAVSLQAPAEVTTNGAALLPLRLEGVSCTVDGQVLVRDLTFSVEAGAPTVLLGGNGAGKTVTLKLCHGLLRPTAGRVVWGRSPGTPPAWEQAMVLHRPVLLRRSVLQNVLFALKAAGVPRATRRQRAEAALAETGIAELAPKPARLLSAGQQQRLNLARTWAMRPHVLFLDEPTAHLDPEATWAFEQTLARITAAGTKVVLTTHDLAQARRLGHDVLFLHGGRLLEQAPAADFFATPRTPEARAFMEGRLTP